VVLTMLILFDIDSLIVLFIKNLSGCHMNHYGFETTFRCLKVCNNIF